MCEHIFKLCKRVNQQIAFVCTRTHKLQDFKSLVWQNWHRTSGLTQSTTNVVTRPLCLVESHKLDAA